MFFLFVNREYEGIFPSEGDALIFAQKKFTSKPNIFIIPMYPEVFGEYKETCSISTRTEILCLTDKNI